MIETQPLEVLDFTRGITDYFIDGGVNQYERMDNLLINVNKKPVTRPGCEVELEEQLPLGVFRVNAQFFYGDDLFGLQHRRAYYPLASAWTELTGPAADPLFPTGGSDMIISKSDWRGHVFLSNDQYSSPQKVFKDAANNYKVRNAGLPDIPAGVVITNPAGVGSTYLYTFVFRYDYNVQTVVFTDRGPTYLYPSAVTGGAITGGNGASITLPTTLVVNENWDTANIEIEIYRTLDAGDTFYLVDTVPLGTAVYLDEETDATIELNETLYTTGGVVSNDPVPKCKYLHMVNDIGYYASILDGTEYDEYLVRQSVPGDPDAAPLSFFAKTEQKIKGLSSIFDRPLVFCDKYVYRIDGQLTLTGIGDMVLTRIDDNAGCMSQSSIVQTHKGIFWAGINGFYWSDGFKVMNISKDINKRTYPQFTILETRQRHINGDYDPNEDRVYWNVCKDDAGNEPDMTIVLDLKWGISESCTFTTMSGGDSYKPTSVIVKDKKIYRGDTRGYILRHEEGLFTDKIIDTAEDPVDWMDQVIIHDYKSCFVDFGSKFVRKIVPRILISAANTTNLSLAIHSSNDNNRVQGDLKPIRYRNNITWGDTLPVWGDPEAIWNKQGVIEQWRRFPAGGLRCQYKQIQLTNAEVRLFTSDLLGTVTVNATAKTATLGGSYTWPPDMVGYYIQFPFDGYTNKWLITARTPTTITYEDTLSQTIDGVMAFTIVGKPKGEVLELNGYVLHWSFLSKSHTPFSASSLGSDP
jgi:hypothetical protein